MDVAIRRNRYRNRHMDVASRRNRYSNRHMDVAINEIDTVIVIWM